jgi:catechol 2,3-dioxygenase
VIAPSARIGAVHLTISDVDRSVRFYQERLGFAVHQTAPHQVSLGAGGDDLLVLHQSPQAPRVRETTGLYHFAILVPSREDLARSLRRLAETDTVLQGAADHGVSEALYLADPDGIGIEIYRDRPRAEWPMVNGHLQMGADLLAFDTLLAEPVGDGSVLPPGTILGHVHLHVPNLETAREFYVGVLGFELMQRYGPSTSVGTGLSASKAGPSALFVSAGGYHHHIGLNTWAGVGAPPPPPGAIGLRHFEVKLPVQAAVDEVVARVKASGLAIEPIGQAALVRDPASNAILFRT